MYKISDVQVITKGAFTFKKGNINAEGMSMEVSVWKSSKGVDEAAQSELYDKFIDGAELDGEVQENGNYKNFVAKAKKTASKTGMINQAMEKKQEGIAHAQENSALNVKIASTFRDATLIANSLLTVEMSEDDIKRLWEHWRAWLWSRFDDPREREWVENMTMPFGSRVSKPDF
jgi:hypothetical protein